MAKYVVDAEHRVNIYLDTNILVDYVEGQYPLLNRSIDYLAKCPCVTLRSSHYVLFELTEVRKFHLFLDLLEPEIAKEFREKKATVKKSWKIGNVDYNDHKGAIKATISNELNKLKQDLNINFDEHVLHEHLVHPTNSLCLSTKISKEDCLVMVSCMNPTSSAEDKLRSCILLSRDEQYCKAFNESKADAIHVFNENELELPEMLRTENLSLKVGATQYNLYQDDEQEIQIETFWNALVKEHLKKNLGDLYLGETYVYGNKEPENKCVYFMIENPEKTLEPSEGLIFISPDLSDRYSLKGPFEYWNNKRIKLPYCNPEDTKYSFMPENISAERLQQLRREGMIVYYDNI